MLGTSISGTLNAPAGVISAGGGNVISAGGGNVISAGGGNVISAGGGNLTAGRTLMALQSKPLAGVEVYLAGADGKPVPHVAPTVTDAQGRFHFGSIPVGFTMLVVASVKTSDGKPLALKSLARSQDGGSNADVDLTTTLVTEAVMDGHQGDMGDFRPEVFKQALSKAGDRLAGDGLDLADHGALLARVSQVAAAVPELKQAIDTMRSEIEAHQVPIAEMASQAAELAKQPAPAASQQTTTTTAVPTQAGSTAPLPARSGLPGVITNIVMATASGAAGAAPFAISNPTAPVSVSTLLTRPTDANSPLHWLSPMGLAADDRGRVLVADRDGQTLHLVDQNGGIATLAGAGVAGYRDDTGVAAAFAGPVAVALDKNGLAYVVEQANNAVRVAAQDGSVKTLLDGKGGLNAPAGVAIAPDGTLYVADTGNHRIVKLAGGKAVPFAGSGTAGNKDGAGTAAAFNAPTAIVTDAQGTLYVADTGNSEIRKVAPDGTVSTLAGTGTASFSDDVGSFANFNQPKGLAIDAHGNLYVADTGNQRIRLVTPDGTVKTIAGFGQIGTKDGAPGQAQFNAPSALVIDSLGGIVVADSGSGNLRRISF